MALLDLDFDCCSSSWPSSLSPYSDQAPDPSREASATASKAEACSVGEKRPCAPISVGREIGVGLFSVPAPWWAAMAARRSMDCLRWSEGREVVEWVRAKPTPPRFGEPVDIREPDKAAVAMGVLEAEVDVGMQAVGS